MITAKTRWHSSILNTTFDTEDDALIAERDFMVNLLTSFNNEGCLWYIPQYTTDEIYKHLSIICKLIASYFCINELSETKYEENFFLSFQHQKRMQKYCKLLRTGELGSTTHNISIIHAIYLKPAPPEITSPEQVDQFCGRIDRIQKAMMVIDKQVEALVPPQIYAQGLVLVCKIPNPNWSGRQFDDVWCVIKNADMIINQMKALADIHLNGIIK